MGLFSLPPRQNGLCGPPTLLFPRVKRTGREADHAPPASAEIKNEWSYAPTPQYVFMAEECTTLRVPVMNHI